MRRTRSTSRRLTAASVTALTSVLLAACSLSGVDDPRTLAKVDGFRAGFQTPPNTFATLEVAYDAETAQEMWDASIPRDLPSAEGNPVEQKRYGDLSEVDFTQQAVALWSGGQSGSCPGWVSKVSTEGDVVTVTEDLDTGGSNGCSADYRPYRTFVVIDRDELPDPAALAQAEGTTGGTVPLSVLVVAYPVGVDS